MDAKQVATMVGKMVAESAEMSVELVRWTVVK